MKDKLGISIIYKLKDKMVTFVENDIWYLEFRILDDDEALLQERVEIILQEKAKSGIQTYTIHLPHKEEFDLSALDEEKRTEALKRQMKVLDGAYALKPSVAVIHPSSGQVPLEEYESRKEALIRSLKEFCPYCKSLGICVALENLTQVSMVQSSSELLEIVEAVGDNIGICFDVNHLFKESHKEFIRNAGKHIITMHISDNDGIRERHMMPGDGVINWEELFEELDNIGFDGTMIVECGDVINGFPDSVPALCERWEQLHNVQNGV